MQKRGKSEDVLTALLDIDGNFVVDSSVFNAATAEYGRAVLENQKLKKIWLDPADEGSEEWWRKALTVHGVFEYLRSLRKGSIQNLYQKRVRGLMKYRQAQRCDRVGRFLKKYPRFM